MKTILTLILILWASAAFGAEWLGCDVPDASEDVVGYAVVVDSQPETIVPYQLNQAQDAVLLWDVTGVDSATLEIQAINSQGRRSDPTPFLLKPKPSALSGYRIIQE